MKNVLITGGAGFIGSYLSLKLIERGYKIKILDNLSPQIHGHNPGENSFLFNKIKNQGDFLLGDVTNRNDMESAIRAVDIVVHFASETGTGQSMYELKRYSDVNLGGTSLLLDVLGNNPNTVKKVIIASSRAIYGEGMYLDKDNKSHFPQGRKLEQLQKGDFNVYDDAGKEVLQLTATPESSKLAPVSFYGITKLFQEQAVLLICKSLGIEGVALRFQNVYGPGQSLKNPYTGLLAVFSNQLMLGKDINIFEDGLESRDFIYIDDIIDATVLAIEKREANGLAFNVGTGVGTSVLKIATLLKKLYNSDVQIKINGDFRVGDIRHNYADNTLIESLLGFKSKISIEEGLTNYVNWVRQQPQEINDNYKNSIEEMLKKKMYFKGNK